MPDKDKKNGKKITNIATSLAVAGMGAGMFTNYKPEDISAYCLAVATAITSAEADSD